MKFFHDTVLSNIRHVLKLFQSVFPKSQIGNRPIFLYAIHFNKITKTSSS